MAEDELNSCFEEWDELDKEYQNLEEVHKNYCRRVDEVKAMQQKCLSGIAHHRYRIKHIMDASKKLEKSGSPEDKEKVKELNEKINDRKRQFRELEDVLPHKNGIYLTIILGSVNVSLLSKLDKYLYKEDYERFKIIITMITIVLAVILLLFVDYRFIDAGFQFLLVWYYCTLTIREHILKVNGSRIKGWWIAHHFVSTVCAGILLIWPHGFTYTQFRQQFVMFSLYISLVQVGQYYYQKGCLYRLRALGERHNMDLTVEGFQSWMWRGLGGVLPFLFIGYFFQLYNSFTLMRLAMHPECTEWEVPVLSFIFFVLFFGNTWTSLAVVRQKLKKEGWMRNLDFHLRNKYRFTRFSNKVHTT